jgi:predicted ATPase
MVSTFVGRQPELDHLACRWQAVGGGAPHLTVIVGEPGIGKTCLAVQAALDARAQGATVLFGRC